MTTNVLEDTDPLTQKMMPHINPKYANLIVYVSRSELFIVEGVTQRRARAHSTKFCRIFEVTIISMSTCVIDLRKMHLPVENDNNAFSNMEIYDSTTTSSPHIIGTFS